jgi:hypothetical protein
MQLKTIGGNCAWISPFLEFPDQPFLNQAEHSDESPSPGE